MHTFTFLLLIISDWKIHDFFFVENNKKQHT